MCRDWTIQRFKLGSRINNFSLRRKYLTMRNITNEIHGAASLLVIYWFWRQAPRFSEQERDRYLYLSCASADFTQMLS